MAHSNPCCCWASLDLHLSSRTGISRDLNFSHWRFPVCTTRTESHVNVFRRDDLFVLHTLQCWFLFKCFKFSLCWRSLYLLLLCDEGYLKRETERKWWGLWQTGPLCLMFPLRDDGDGTRTLHTLTACWTLKTNTILSLFFSPSSSSSSVWLSDHFKQWGLNPGQLQWLHCIWWLCVDIFPLEWPVEKACSDSIGIAYLP